MATYTIRPTSVVQNGGGITPSTQATILTNVGDNSDATTVQHTTNSPVTWLFGLGTPTIASGEYVARVSPFIRWKDGGSGMDPTTTYIGAGVYYYTETPPAVGSILTDGRTSFITQEVGYRIVTWTPAQCANLRLKWYDGKNNSGSPAVTTAELGANIYTIALATATPSNVTSTQSYPVIPVTTAITLDWEVSTTYAQYLKKVTTEVRIESGGSGVGTGTLITSTTVDNNVDFTTNLSLNITLPIAVPNGTYKIYARALRYRENGLATTDTTGSWSTAYTLTQNVATPLAPVITGAAWDSTNQRTAITVSANMLSNPSFDTNTTGWSNYGNATLARVTTPTQAGAGSLSLTSVAAGAMYASTSSGVNAMPVVASQTYTGSAYVRAASLTRDCRIILEWYSAAGSYISQSYGSYVTNSTSAWVRATVTAVAPVNAAFCAIILGVNATAAASEVHYWDSVQFELGSVSTLYRETGVYSTGAQTWDLQRSDDGGTTWAAVRGATAGNSIAASALPTGWTVYDYEAPRARKNLVQNSSFEATAITPWTSAESSTLTRVTSLAYVGSACLQVSSAASGNATARYWQGTSLQYLLPGVAGQTYTASAYVRSATVSRSAQIGILWLDSAGTYISGASGTTAATSLTSWTRVTYSATAPANAVYCYVQVNFLSTAAAGEIHYIDAVQFEQASSVSSFDASGVLYRARSSSTATGITYTSAWGTIRPAAVPAENWNLKVPQDSTLNDLDVSVIGLPGEELTEDMGVFRALDRRYPVVVAGTLGGWDGDLQMVTASDTEWATLKAVLECQKVLLLESPYGWSKYIRIVSGARVQSAGTNTAPRRYVSVSYVQTQAP